jgi:hypothetical protein
MREALAVMMGRLPAVSVAAFGTLDLQLHRVHPPARWHARATIRSPSCRGLERFRELQTVAPHLLGRAVLERS